MGVRALSLERIHLRKLLKIVYSTERARTALLRADIRSDLQKENGGSTGGGDFHGPFWADAKRHVAGNVDLQLQGKLRIQSNKRRERLYPELMTAFLKWWDEKRRWRNEPFEVLPEAAKARFPIKGLGIVKIENLLSLRINDQSNRIIYPYFSETPVLPEEGVRIGLWLLSEALPQYDPSDLRILDILRSASYGTGDVPFRGNEGEALREKYSVALAKWRELRKEYQ